MNESDEVFLIDYYQHSYLTERPQVKRADQAFCTVIGYFSAFLRRHATLADLNKDTLNGFLAHQQRLGRAPRTLKGYRGILLSLWGLAFEDEKIHNPIRGVRRIKVPRRLPDAWTSDELEQLLEGCYDKRLYRKMRVAPVVQGLYLRAFILFTYDTALRHGDVLTVRRSEIRKDCTFFRMQSKTQNEIPRKLRPETVKEINRLVAQSGSDFVFGFVGQLTVQRMWRKLLIVVGFPVHGRNGPQKLRRTSVSHLVRKYGRGVAQDHLGHLTPGLAEQSYIAPNIAGMDIPLPPAIGGRQR